MRTAKAFDGIMLHMSAPEPLNSGTVQWCCCGFRNNGCAVATKSYKSVHVEPSISCMILTKAIQYTSIHFHMVFREQEQGHPDFTTLCELFICYFHGPRFRLWAHK